MIGREAILIGISRAGIKRGRFYLFQSVGGGSESICLMGIVAFPQCILRRQM